MKHGWELGEDESPRESRWRKFWSSAFLVVVLAGLGGGLASFAPERDGPNSAERKAGRGEWLSAKERRRLPGPLSPFFKARLRRLILGITVGAGAAGLYLYRTREKKG